MKEQSKASRMCGRYTYVDPDRVAEAMVRDFGVVIESEVPRYNVAPSQIVPIIHADESGKLLAEKMRWGFIPFWDKSEKPKIAPINARSEEAFGNLGVCVSSLYESSPPVAALHRRPQPVER